MDLKNNNFETFEQKLDNLYNSNKLNSAIELLLESAHNYPDHQYEINRYLIYIYLELGDYDKCFNLLKKEISNGHFFALKWDSWNPLRSFPGWDNLETKCNRLLAAEILNSKMEYKVFTPSDYNPETEYPLIFLLHGDGGNISDFTRSWNPSALLKQGYIVTYIQSSCPVETKFYEWTSDFSKARMEIEDCYNAVLSMYRIKKDRVVLSGFSGGAMASLNLLMHNAFPIKGVILLCANQTPDCNAKNISNAAKSGVKIFLAEGELSGEVEVQSQLISLCNRCNLPATKVTNKGVSHQFPNNWDSVADDALKFINNQ